MAGKQAFEKKLADLQALRAGSKSAESIDALRKALRDRSNYVVAKAADVAGELKCIDLIPELSAAFERFLDDAVKTDPQCWAKNAIVKALVAFEHEDPQLYLRGLKHVQPEPVFGGSRDTAAPLRGACGHALGLCHALDDLTILRHLVDLLADAEHPARIEAARAMAQLGRPEGALVLRLKVYCGDEREQVAGHAMSALLSLEPKDGVPVVAGILNHANEDQRFEAAAALAESREPEAFEALRRCYARARDPRFRKALLVSMGASLQPCAIDFLIALIGPGDLRTAQDAVAALEPARYRDEVRDRIEAAVKQTGSDSLAQAFRKVFGDK